MLSFAATLRAGFAPIYGGPTYDPAADLTYDLPGLSIQPSSSVGSGTVAGQARRLTKNGSFVVDTGIRPVRWDASGAAPVELGNLGTGANGFTQCNAIVINAAGTAVGAMPRISAGVDLGVRAVRWDPSGTAAIELTPLGTASNGVTSSGAAAINGGGTIVGYAEKYVAGVDLGSAAVRWNPSGTIVTELGNLGTDAKGTVSGRAQVISSTGTMAGISWKPGLGWRPVRWDASGAVATELGTLGDDGTGAIGRMGMVGINSAGTAVGYLEKYSGGADVGLRAVRWDASGTSATELGSLGTDVDGLTTTTNVLAMNEAGTAVGNADKYSGGNFVGTRAVRWSLSGTAAAELGNLGTDSFGYTQSQAYAINNSGLSVGYCDKIDAGGNVLGQVATMWGPDGAAIDLNTLIDPTSGWTLTEADGISDTNWVSGIGQFGGYPRAFLIEVPEPGTAAIAGAALIGLLASRRVSRFNRPSHHAHTSVYHAHPHIHQSLNQLFKNPGTHARIPKRIPAHTSPIPRLHNHLTQFVIPKSPEPRIPEFSPNFPIPDSRPHGASDPGWVTGLE
jgi:hypothetical protein